MELDRVAGLPVAPRRFILDEAYDELLDASKRTQPPRLAMARALAALAEGVMSDDEPVIAAARHEWRPLLEREVA